MSKIAEKYEIDLTTEHKCGCPRCMRKGRDKSRNNLHVYGATQSAFCWSCGFTIPSEEHRKRMGWDDEDDEEEEDVMTRERITPAENEAIKRQTGNNGKGFRGIKTETNKFFGVRYQYDEATGEPVKQFVPTTINYELVGYRTRGFPKDFSNPIGQVGKECDMVGEFRFRNHTRTCLIVGGEIKLLAAYQMLDDDRHRRNKEEFESTAVVCSTLGESGAHKQIQSRYSFFDQFEKIIICMDEDEAGQEATEKIAKVLPKGKAFVMKMRYKDADEYIKEGAEKDFIRDFWNAKPYTPAGVVGSGELSNKIREEASSHKISFPPFMRKVNEMTAGGLGLGKICNIGAASGQGKTVYVDTIIHHLIFNSPYQVGVVSMELNAGQYGLSMLSRHIKRKISNIQDREERINFLEQDWVKAKEQELFFREDGSHRWHLVDDRDGSLEDLQELVEELVIRCGCKLIVLDPIQDILDGLSNEEQALFLKWQKGMVKSHNMSFININHVRKSGGGKEQNSTGAMISEEDFAGSSTIFKSAALNILLVRDKMAEDEFVRNTTKGFISKNRDNGLTGPCGEYYYDNQTHTLWDKDDYIKAHNR